MIYDIFAPAKNKSNSKFKQEVDNKIYQLNSHNSRAA